VPAHQGKFVAYFRVSTDKQGKSGPLTFKHSGVEFVSVDNPHANKLTIHILAAVAQHEREMISQRTRDAL
jgi:hypothetical protein